MAGHPRLGPQNIRFLTGAGVCGHGRVSKGRRNAQVKPGHAMGIVGPNESRLQMRFQYSPRILPGPQQQTDIPGEAMVSERDKLRGLAGAIKSVGQFFAISVQYFSQSPLARSVRNCNMHSALRSNHQAPAIFNRFCNTYR
jgi:hypothetical protein